MAKTRPEILTHKLIKNSLKKEQMNELLQDIKSGEKDSQYSEVLREHFEKILLKLKKK